MRTGVCDCTKGFDEEVKEKDDGNYHAEDVVVCVVDLVEEADVELGVVETVPQSEVAIDEEIGQDDRK